MAKITATKSTNFREGLVIGLLLIIPLIFNIFSGGIEGVKLITLSVFTLILLGVSLNKIRNEQNILTKGIVVLLMACTAATIFAYNPLLSLIGSTDRYFGLLTWIAGLLLALGVSSLFKTGKRRLKLLKALSLSGSLAAAFSVLIYFLSSGDPYFDGRIAGSLGNPNILGKFLLLTIIPSIYMASTKEAGSRFWIFATLLQLAVLWLTGNRASWLALIIVGLIYAVKFTKSSTKLIFATIIAATITTIFSWSRICDITSIQSRLEMYWAGLKAFVANPVYGYGFDQTEFFLDLPHFTLAPDRVHQLFLDMALTTGIFGLISFSIICVASLIILLKSKDPTLKIPGLALLALLISLQASFFTIVTFTVFSVFIGLALGTKPPLRFLRKS